ncbi:MAG: alpha/beta fold hydrolase [Deltaproteobacteria bacterium]|jgi:alpha-beta hydrolase superfamily lysophospholipase|nr:alpha/beta fold hydrolase [Deltaproteobacteria bacterium]MBW2537959.1 alpha/beta fold hydrolase [Deltaproteobacteria bacterium]
MILNSSLVEQAIDGDSFATFVKEIILARPRVTGVPISAADGTDIPLAMVRKRLLPGSAATGTLAAEVGPTKAPVLLLHGYGQNHYAWHLPARSFANYLAAAGYDVFNLDLRGHGRSRHLGARPPKNLAEYVREDVPAAIEEIRRLSSSRPLFLVGHSLGGLISYAVAPLLSDAVAGVVTLGSPYHFTRGSRFLAMFGTAMLTLDRTLSFGHGLVPLRHLAEVMRIARVFVESPVFPLPIRGFSPGSLEPRVLGQHMSLAMDRGSVAVMRNLFLRAAEARASGHRLGVLYGYASAFEAADLPLLIIAGSRDGLAPPSSVRPAYVRSHSSDKTYRAFPRGHIDLLVGRDAPTTIWPLVLAWLNTRVRRLGDRLRVDPAASVERELSVD